MLERLCFGMPFAGDYVRGTGPDKLPSHRSVRCRHLFGPRPGSLMGGDRYRRLGIVFAFHVLI